MTGVTLLLCLVAAQQDIPASTGGIVDRVETRESSPRRFHDIDQDILAALRLAQRARSFDEKAVAIYELVDLHREIVRDSRFTESDILQQYRGRVASPLIKFKAELSRTMREEKNKKKPASSVTATHVSDALADQFSLLGYSMGGPINMAVP